MQRYVEKNYERIRRNTIILSRENDPRNIALVCLLTTLLDRNFFTYSPDQVIEICRSAKTSGDVDIICDEIVAIQFSDDYNEKKRQEYTQIFLSFDKKHEIIKGLWRLKFMKLSPDELKVVEKKVDEFGDKDVSKLYRYYFSKDQSSSFLFILLFMIILVILILYVL